MYPRACSQGVQVYKVLTPFNQTGRKSIRKVLEDKKYRKWGWTIYGGNDKHKEAWEMACLLEAPTCLSAIMGNGPSVGGTHVSLFAIMGTLQSRLLPQCISTRITLRSLLHRSDFREVGEKLTVLWQILLGSQAGTCTSTHRCALKTDSFKDIIISSYQLPHSFPLVRSCAWNREVGIWQGNVFLVWRCRDWRFLSCLISACWVGRTSSL